MVSIHGLLVNSVLIFTSECRSLFFFFPLFSYCHGQGWFFGKLTGSIAVEEMAKGSPAEEIKGAIRSLSHTEGEMALSDQCSDSSQYFLMKEIPKPPMSLSLHIFTVCLFSQNWIYIFPAIKLMTSCQLWKAI